MSPLVDCELAIVHGGSHNQGALTAYRREHRHVVTVLVIAFIATMFLGVRPFAAWLLARSSR